MVLLKQLKHVSSKFLVIWKTQCGVVDRLVALLLKV